jgi:hypothetical protein
VGCGHQDGVHGKGEAETAITVSSAKMSLPQARSESKSLSWLITIRREGVLVENANLVGEVQKRLPKLPKIAARFSEFNKEFL